MDYTSIESLLSARDILKSGIDVSVSLGIELDRTGHRLDEISRRLASLGPGLEPVLAIEDRVDCGTRPACAILRVYEAVRELEASLAATSPARDLSGYISLMRRLEQALKFLGNNCRLAIQWLQGVAEFLEEHGAANDRLVSNLNSSMAILQELKGTKDRVFLEGGIIDFAFRKLVVEFSRILEENSAKYPRCTEEFPDPVILQLQAIIERLKTSNRRLEKCVLVYVSNRTANIRSGLDGLDLVYLDEPIGDSQSVEARVKKWAEDLRVVVKGVLGNEHRLCHELFGGEFGSECFGEIVGSGSGIGLFLGFGKRVAESKKSPGKLINLLDVFGVLDELRPEFSRVFGGKNCEEVRALTRDLVQRVVEGSLEIFWELPCQVEVQRRVPPPADGSVPRLVSFVTEYCNQLLSDAYRPRLIQVMVIHRSWKHEKYTEGTFTNQIYNIIKEVGLNLDTWARSYNDRALSCLFMMNNHSHFSRLRGTSLGDVMGDPWSQAHEEYAAHYAAVYVNECWAENIATRLRTGPPENRIEWFNRAFEQTLESHGRWIVDDENLRDDLRRRVREAVVPAYRDYLENYYYGRDESETVKYSVEELEAMIGSLFGPEQRKVGNNGPGYYAIGDKFPSVVTNDNRLRLTLTAA